jgi:hypothetical protein
MGMRSSGMSDSRNESGEAKSAVFFTVGQPLLVMAPGGSRLNFRFGEEVLSIGTATFCGSFSYESQLF